MFYLIRRIEENRLAALQRKKSKQQETTPCQSNNTPMPPLSQVPPPSHKVLNSVAQGYAWIAPPLRGPPAATGIPRSLGQYVVAPCAYSPKIVSAPAPQQQQQQLKAINDVRPWVDPYPASAASTAAPFPSSKQQYPRSQQQYATPAKPPPASATFRSAASAYDPYAAAIHTPAHTTNRQPFVPNPSIPPSRQSAVRTGPLLSPFSSSDLQPPSSVSQPSPSISLQALPEDVKR